MISFKLCIWVSFAQSFCQEDFTDFTHTSLQVVRSTAAYVKKLYKAFCGSRGSCVKSDQLPQVMGLESASDETEDNKFENENNLGVWSWKGSEVTSSLLLIFA